MIQDIFDFVVSLRELGLSGLTVLIIILLMLRFFDINKKISEEKEEALLGFWGTVGAKLRTVLIDVKNLSFSRCEALALKRLEALDFVIVGLEDSINVLSNQIAKATVLDNSITVTPEVPCDTCKPNYSLLIENRITRVQFLQSEINAHKTTIREHKKEKEKIYKDLDIIESMLTLSLYEHHSEALTELKRLSWKGLTGANLDKYLGDTSEILLLHNRQRIKAMVNPRVMFFEIPEQRYGLEDAKKHFNQILSFTMTEYESCSKTLSEITSDNPFLPFGIERIFLKKEQ